MLAPSSRVRTAFTTASYSPAEIIFWVPVAFSYAQFLAQIKQCTH